jgi:hypothetical protein
MAPKQTRKAKNPASVGFNRKKQLIFKCFARTVEEDHIRTLYIPAGNPEHARHKLRAAEPDAVIRIVCQRPVPEELDI